MRLLGSFFRIGLFIAACLATLAILLRLVGLLAVYKVPTNAMAPFLNKGDTIIAQGLSVHSGLPRRGDVITFTTEGIAGIQTGGKPQIYIKRVAGLPGDKVQMVGDVLHINDRPVSEYYDVSKIRYVSMGHGETNLVRPYVVPPNHLLALGDNSANSSDSRFWGPVPVKNLRQVYWCHLWKAAPAARESGGR